MSELKSHKLILLLASLLLASYALTGNAQDQTGFISIDCGLQSNISRYNETTTGVSYIPDWTFIETGETRMIAEKYRGAIQQQFWSLRSFPAGNRNCYRIDVAKGTKYLLRAAFLYGDHDGQGMAPSFDLYLGADYWDTIKFKSPSDDVSKEIVHVMRRDYVHVCLVNTGQGVPFVSAIELRPLDDSAYETPLGSLKLFVRRDAGASQGSRFGTAKDIHDRLWASLSFVSNWTSLNTTETIESKDPENDHYNVPSKIMSTAATPKNPNASLDIYWIDANADSLHYIYLHFAEIEKLEENESREFNIFYNGKFFQGPISPSYLRTTTVTNSAAFSGPFHNFSIARTERSTHPPIINAFETYTFEEFPQSESDQQDVDAITKLKSTYKIRRNWQGDPCAPKDNSWEGLTCVYDGPPRITSLNLSASGLTGEIAPSIASMSMLEELNLSNNNFTGSIPDFLSKLPKLKIINLENNQLNGSIPVELVQKRDKGVLSLNVNGNTNLCASESASCGEKKSADFPVMAVSIAAGSLVFIVVFASVAWWFLRRKRQHDFVKANDAEFGEYSVESRKRKFTFSEIKRITNNFEKVIGKGAFGTVYHGRVGDIQVAVKVLSPSAVQGFQQFQAEVNILFRVYHRNLTTLVGYFNDENRAGLVYEFMANGDLQSHLSDQNNSPTILTWEERLQIALDAGQGLEYLHQGCKPPIVHRDIKSANILLNENFQAKLSDFGISKTFPTDSDASYVSTVVAGTPGYLDPEYFKSNRLNEKSDVYSFGVLLLEIITGRPAISKRYGDTCQWVASMIEKGLINKVIDPRLQGNFNLNSAWKLVEIAMNCVSFSSANRPNMGEVVGELKLCLEMTRNPEARERDSRGLSDTIPLNFSTDHVGIQPSAR